MKRVIVITGTPCSGKTTISEKLLKRIRNSELIKANEVVKSKRLFTGYSGGREMIANMPALKKELEKQIRASNAELVIVEGHLLCDISIRGAVAIVIREHLNTLLDRMKKRGYRKGKIEDNIVSEAIDYCGVNSAENYMEVHEVMGGAGAVASIESIMKGRKKGGGEVDMLNELNGLAKKLGKQII
ncbi:MAG: AAA family ATPase [Candidatus Micrarchaeaceae archaeon]